MRSAAPRGLPICTGWLRRERSSPLLPSALPPRGQKQLQAKQGIVQSPHDPEHARQLHKQAYAAVNISRRAKVIGIGRKMAA